MTTDYINTEDIKNCYRKLKSSIYFQKNLSYLKNKIVEFEYNDDLFEKTIFSLTNSINCRDSSYFKSLVSNVDFYVLPKKLKDKPSTNELITNKTESRDKINVEEVNFYFNASIQLFIVDVLFTLLLGKRLNQNKMINRCCYANVFDRDLFSSEDEINYKSLRIFANYYPLYKKWKNEAIKASQNLFKEKKDSSIISLDITGFYYSISDSIRDILSGAGISFEENSVESFLQEILQNCIEKYSSFIKKYRLDIAERILPIGLNTSCVLANLYLNEFDERLSNKSISYGRYVDDIIFVIEGCDYNQFSDYVDANPDFFTKTDSGDFVLVGFENLKVKKEKCRIIRNYKDGSDYIFDKLYSEERTVSDYNLFPSFNADIDFLVNEAYKKQENIKIRDVENIRIDPSKIGKVTSGLITSVKGVGSINENSFSKFRLNFLKVISNGDLLLLYSRWERMFLLLSLGKKKASYRTLSQRLSTMRNKVVFSPKDISMYGDGRKRHKENKELTKVMRNSLNVFYETALYGYLALVGTSVNKTDSKYSTPVLMYRKASFVDYNIHHYPMLIFCKDIDPSINLKECSFDTYMNLLERGTDINRIALSPFYISLSDYMWASQMNSIMNEKNMTLIDIYNKYYSDVAPLFGTPKENISIKSKDVESGYRWISIDFTNSKTISFNSLHKEEIDIAIAGINVKRMNITKGDDVHIHLNRSNPDYQVKKAVIDLLNDSYINSFKENKKEIRKIRGDQQDKDLEKDRKKGTEKRPVNYILFPESFLPYQWVHLVDKFAKETMCTITTGIRYIVYKKKVYNLVATVIPYFNSAFHKQSFVVFREKNVMPLYERNILKRSGFEPHNICPNTYYTIKKDGVSILPLICYEATDVKVRSIFKNHVDYIFSVEYNKDINYFQSIGMATSRDLFCYFVECNYSNYGSASFAPMRNQFIPIASDKNNYRDHMFILRTDLASLLSYKEGYKLAYTSYDDYEFTDSKKKLIYDKKKSKFKKPSANS